MLKLQISDSSVGTTLTRGTYIAIDHHEGGGNALIHNRAWNDQYNQQHVYTSA